MITMPRITRDELDARVERLNRMGVPIIIEYAGEPLRPRAYLEAPGGTWERELSPRLTPGQMSDWLDAFEKGFDIGHTQATEAIKKIIKETAA
jgi:hypothetical protein